MKMFISAVENVAKNIPTLTILGPKLPYICTTSGEIWHGEMVPYYTSVDQMNKSHARQPNNAVMFGNN